MSNPNTIISEKKKKKKSDIVQLSKSMVLLHWKKPLQLKTANNCIMTTFLFFAQTVLKSSAE